MNAKSKIGLFNITSKDKLHRTDMCNEFIHVEHQVEDLVVDYWLSLDQ
jgi:hypothetical protein